MDQNQLLSRIRTEGRRVSLPRIGDAIYEMDGRLWRYFCPPEKDREPGSGPWRVEPVEGPAEGRE